MKLKGFMVKAVLFALLTGSYGFTQNITDIIKPLRLVSGKTGEFRVSDIYYAKDYNIKFGGNQFLKVEYSAKDSILKVTTTSDFEGITLLPFEYNKTKYQIPVVAAKQRFHTFKFKPAKKYKHLTVIGQFNAWNRQYDPMTDTDGDGVY